MAVGKPIWTDSKGCSLPDQIQYGDTGHLITEGFFLSRFMFFDKKNRQLSGKCMLRNFLVKKQKKTQL